MGKPGRPFGPKGRFIAPCGIGWNGGAGGGFGLSSVIVMTNMMTAPAPATAASIGMLDFDDPGARAAGAAVEGAAAAGVAGDDWLSGVEVSFMARNIARTRRIARWKRAAAIDPKKAPPRRVALAAAIEPRHTCAPEHARGFAPPRTATARAGATSSDG